MFDYLHLEVIKLPESKIKNDYPDIFELFDKAYLPNQQQADLINIIKCLSKIENSEIKKTLGLMRQFLEAIFRRINEVHARIVPDYLVAGDEVQVGKIYKVVSRRTYI
ncbi:hypothetical protein Q0590_29015 [Rhodocytophaga aerolata]|uniref:Uncharacterized protein n=1 Tax=Rhodocytophaga aerolata TaxID=455078 RepID=A0ABT8RE23_9BACT|nr:hypothetical protein [Rhodocytophaga aerolata]MDO1450352.1 hypothetical protein [Rhodocytophaga aerolata]